MADSHNRGRPFIPCIPRRALRHFARTVQWGVPFFAACNRKNHPCNACPELQGGALSNNILLTPALLRGAEQNLRQSEYPPRNRTPFLSQNTFARMAPQRGNGTNFSRQTEGSPKANG